MKKKIEMKVEPKRYLEVDKMSKIARAIDYNFKRIDEDLTTLERLEELDSKAIVKIWKGYNRLRNTIILGGMIVGLLFITLFLMV